MTVIMFAYTVGLAKDRLIPIIGMANKFRTNVVVVVVVRVSNVRGKSTTTIDINLHPSRMQRSLVYNAEHQTRALPVSGHP